MSSTTAPAPAPAPFWLKNPNVLLSPAYVTEIFPTASFMSVEQQLNALTRLLFLATLALFAMTRDARLLLFSSMTLAAICVYYQYNYQDSDARDVTAKNQQESYSNRAVDALGLSEKQQFISNELFGAALVSNPFGNVLLTDYTDNPTKKPAPPAHNDNFLTVPDDDAAAGDGGGGGGVVVANYENSVMNEAMNLVLAAHPDQPDLAEKLFKDMSDQYVFEQSLRPFFSNPSTTIPNDQQGFAEFCYGSMTSCKEGNMFACARNLPNYTTP